MTKSLAGLALFILLGRPGAAHRLDEYLHTSLISLSRDRIQIQLDLTPGVALLPVVLATIDKDRDGTISELERNDYAAQVLRDVSLSVDGKPVRLGLVSSRFPEIAQMKEGVGIIRLEMAAALLASWSGRNRRISFENHHQSRIAAYLVNSQPCRRLRGRPLSDIIGSYFIGNPETIHLDVEPASRWTGLNPRGSLLPATSAGLATQPSTHAP